MYLDEGTKDRAIFIFESVLRSGEVSTKRKKKKALLSHEKVVRMCIRSLIERENNN